MFNAFRGFIRLKRVLIFLSVFILSGIFIICFVGCGGGGGADSPPPPPDTSILLSWDPPTKYEDGSDLTDIAGYKVYFGTSSRNYNVSIDIGDTETFSLDNHPSGTWYFSVTVYDSWRVESDFSQELVVDLN